MNRIERMIAEMCPDGVAWKPLGEVVQLVTGGTPNKHVPEYWEDGTIPWMSSGEVNKKHVYSTDGFITELGLLKSNAKMVSPRSVVIALAGQGKTRGKVATVEIELSTNQSLCTLVPGREISYRFLYHFLDGQYEKLRSISSGEGARGGLSLAILKSFVVPVPPIEIQREIVDILDSFTRLEAELGAELGARKVQYSFLRNMLLNFEFSAKNVSVNLLGEEHFDVQEKRLGDIALIKTGRKFEGAFGSGLLPYVNGGVEPSGWVSCANNPGMVITIPSRGSVGIVGFQWDQFWLGPLCYAVTPKEGVDPRFLYHQLKRQQTRLVALQQTGSIPALNKKELVGFVIDVPPLYVQRRIADVLDDFDALVNDLSSGLPAEIAARRQQYEYYRDRLLTFPEKK